jgi:hypothetical protein
VATEVTQTLSLHQPVQVLQQDKPVILSPQSADTGLLPPPEDQTLPMDILDSAVSTLEKYAGTLEKYTGSHGQSQ